LEWGNSDAMLEAIELIAKREGFGNLLAEGTARMAEKIGKGSKDFALHTKGLEPGMHEPRVGSCLAFSFMVSPIGADHNVTQPDGLLENEMFFKQYQQQLGFPAPPQSNDLSPRKVSVFRLSQFLCILYDSLASCHFIGPSFEQIAELLKAVTGWEIGIPELHRIAERIVTLMRLFNIREGVSGEDDVLPDRFFQPTTDGALSNLKADRAAYDKGLKYYYALMGWDAKGVPLSEKVEELYNL
jgi:aldehyde:ferredoxin oxidoreductase